MIHVCTVHWHDERWLAPQLRFLRRFLPSEHRLYASLNGIDERWFSEFDFAADLDGPHHVKLNLLAAEAAKRGAAEDLLLFIDSDAFPIAPIDEGLLGGTPLAAVRRDENMGEQQPHPCFCLTTIGFWSEIDGDWAQGYRWQASNGQMVTDGGGNLLGTLRARGIEWRPLLRSNEVDLDPLWFGIYGDVVYHHGAGSRAPVSFNATLPAREAARRATQAAVIPRSVPLLGRVERSVRYRLAWRRARREIAAYADRSQDLSDEVFGWIEHDDEFYRRFLERSPETGSRSVR
jgi:hypothetical protein